MVEIDASKARLDATVLPGKEAFTQEHVPSPPMPGIKAFSVDRGQVRFLTIGRARLRGPLKRDFVA
jgi:hypothetical protein